METHGETLPRHCASVPHVQHDRDDQRGDAERGDGEVDSRLIPIQSGEPIDVVLHVRGRKIGFTERSLDAPVLVGAWTIAKAIEKPDPRQAGESNRDEVEASRPTPDPPRDIEDDEGAMEDHEEDVEEDEHAPLH